MAASASRRSSGSTHERRSHDGGRHRGRCSRRIAQGGRRARDAPGPHRPARRIEVHAFNLVLADQARAAAAAVDAAVAAGRDPGPLAGVPIALKDNMCTRGVPTTCSSKILDGWKPPYDATVVHASARRPARSWSARPTSTSSPWARAPRTARSVPRSTRTTPPGWPAGPAVAALLRSPRGSPRRASAATPVGPSVSPRRCAVWSASSPRTATSAATAWSPSPARSIRSVRSPPPCTTRP